MEREELGLADNPERQRDKTRRADPFHRAAHAHQGEARAKRPHHKQHLPEMLAHADAGERIEGFIAGDCRGTFGGAFSCLHISGGDAGNGEGPAQQR